MKQPAKCLVTLGEVIMWGIFGDGGAESSTGKLQCYWTVQIVKKVSSCELA